MEEASLLAEALKERHDKELQNTLLLDVFLLNTTEPELSNNNIDTLVQLAQLAHTLNEHFSTNQSNYPWQAGGDGIVFGVHVTDNTIVHLRAQCRYGVSVLDEWYAIYTMLQFLQKSSSSSIAVRCWDIDDGHVILIQGADSLPLWVDEMGPENCDYRCWLYQNSVHLISKPGLVNLRVALDCLRNNIHCEQNQQLLHSIKAAASVPKNNMHHRAAVALPRPVSQLLVRRPDLIPILARHFLEQSEAASKEIFTYTTVPVEDWVWNVHTFPKTTYAMLRTFANQQWDETTTVVSNLEIKKLQQTCQVQSTPHLRHGLQIGMRLLAGLNHCVSQTTPPPPSKQPSLNNFTDERVLVHWSRVAQTVHADTWLRDNYLAGPNHCNVDDLGAILTCPVFDPEILQSETPLSHPETSIVDQIRSELRKKSDESDARDGIPRPDEVDSEDWMTVNEQDLANTVNQTAVVDDVMEGVETFMAGTSSMQGVETKTNERIRIDPTLFLGTLHAALKAKTADELAKQLQPTEVDPFFSEQDYDLMEPEDSSDDEDDDKINMMDLMDAMDEELEGASKLSRALDGQENDQEVSESAHVLSNLLRSLDSSGGGPGPVRNMLSEMGKKAPDLTSEPDS